MPIELVTIPCLSDNYAYLCHDAETKQTLLIDAPEARPILAALDRRDWDLNEIFLTHHHDDHIAGVAEILRNHDAKVTGAAADRDRLPNLDRAVKEWDTVSLGPESGTVWDVSGHTVGHIALYFEASKLVFTADSLMACGCGRLFEGTAEQMWASLCKYAQCPDETLVCSGHEYTLSNVKFAASVDPDNASLQRRISDTAAARTSKQPTVPSTMGLERATNPFLRPNSPEIRAILGMQTQTDAEVFAEIRRRKDNF